VFRSCHCLQTLDLSFSELVGDKAMQATTRLQIFFFKKNQNFVKECLIVFCVIYKQVLYSISSLVQPLVESCNERFSAYVFYLCSSTAAGTGPRAARRSHRESVFLRICFTYIYQLLQALAESCPSLTERAREPASS
jgi:hypothetical protein